VSTAMPPLHTERLVIRPFAIDDLEAAHRVMSDAWGVASGEQPALLQRRERWLRWAVANYHELADLNQPPYGDRAIMRLEDDLLIGSIGLVPSLGPFGLLPGFPANQGSPRFYPEVGLYWAIAPAHQGNGYATEAARAVIDFAFERMNLGRMVATTEHDNARSIRVMQKLDMQILRNPHTEPPWFQVVGVIQRN